MHTQPLARVFPGKGPFATPPQGMEGFVEDVLCPCLVVWRLRGFSGPLGIMLVLCEASFVWFCTSLSRFIPLSRTKNSFIEHQDAMISPLVPLVRWERV